MGTKVLILFVLEIVLLYCQADEAFLAGAGGEGGGGGGGEAPGMYSKFALLLVFHLTIT